MPPRAILDAALGPEAWPNPPDFGPLLDQPRPLYALMRDQHVIAGIGRSWLDEILHAARMSPFRRGSDLSAPDAEVLRSATVSPPAADELREARVALREARYDELVHAANVETDLTRREKLFQEAETILIRDELPVLDRVVA